MLIKTKRDLAPTINISLYDFNKNLLYSGSVHELKISDDIVIQKSIEFFNDAQPCFIHRGAVISRLYGEIEHYIKTNPQQVGLTLSTDQMPFMSYLDEYTGVYYLKYE